MQEEQLLLAEVTPQGLECGCLDRVEGRLGGCGDAWGGGCSDGLKDPLIEALLPARGAPGALVDVVGERFTATRGTVHFGGRPAKVLIWTNQRARVPRTRSRKDTFRPRRSLNAASNNVFSGSNWFTIISPGRSSVVASSK